MSHSMQWVGKSYILMSVGHTVSQLCYVRFPASMLMNLSLYRHVLPTTQLWRRHHRTFIRFDTIPSCDEQTDGIAVANSLQRVALRLCAVKMKKTESLIGVVQRQCAFLWIDNILKTFCGFLSVTTFISKTERRAVSLWQRRLLSSVYVEPIGCHKSVVTTTAWIFSGGEKLGRRF